MGHYIILQGHLPSSLLRGDLSREPPSFSLQWAAKAMDRSATGQTWSLQAWPRRASPGSCFRSWL